MGNKKHISYALALIIGALFLWSLIFLFTLSSADSLKNYGNTYEYFLRQVLVGFLPAVVAGAAAYLIPIAFFRKYAAVLFFLNLVALFMVFIPGLGVNAKGASRWINVAGVGFQPSEFFKVTAIMFVAAWIASKLADEKRQGWKNTLKTGYHNAIYILLPFLVFLGIIFVALYLQRDASTLGIISLTLLVLYFSAKTPLWHTAVIIFLGLSALLLMVKLEPYRWDRFAVFLNPDYDPLGKGFQIKQSLIALGSGGWFGRGWGMSIQKFGYLPEATTDSIFAIVGEEVGFVGCLVLIALFLALFWQGVKLYRRTPDTFSKLTAIGIVFWVSWQTFINMASSAGIFPLAGIPLPFFSLGGSHLVVEAIGMGLLLNISKNG